MEIVDFLDPINPQEFPFPTESVVQSQLGNVIFIYTEANRFPNLASFDIAIVGVKDDRKAFDNEGCGHAPDAIRKFLYQLMQGPYSVKIVDLGNIKTGFTHKDTCFALSSVVAGLIANSVLPVIIGGGQDMTFANYQAYHSLGQIINIVAIDPMFDLGSSEQELNSRSYLSSIILHQPNFLFNYTNIGYQTYFIDQDALKLMQNLFFDAYRLGIVRENLSEVEPMVRNADMISFDISAIRHSDAPGNGNASPHGFYGEEACQITRYAGMSDKLTSIGFYEMNPKFDQSGQTAHLVAQMIWYFIDGFYNRAQDFPLTGEENYVKYRVSIHDHKEEIVFYKSKKTDRWWMEIPLPVEQRAKYERHYLIPCSYKDYQTASDNDIPDRWWMVYQKLM
ncbi:MAG: formimidoylglutamase [Bacteroidetes bacterium]|nr:formimidoylglutamase [Bacteroidota bacterium]